MVYFHSFMLLSYALLNIFPVFFKLVQLSIQHKSLEVEPVSTYILRLLYVLKWSLGKDKVIVTLAIYSNACFHRPQNTLNISNILYVYLYDKKGMIEVGSLNSLCVHALTVYKEKSHVICDYTPRNVCFPRLSYNPYEMLLF